MPSSRRDDDDGDDDGDDGALTGPGMAALARGPASTAQDAQLRARGEEFARLREGLLRAKRAVKVLTGGDAALLQETTAARDLATPLEQRRLKYVKRKTEHGNRSDETFAKLQQFTKSLRDSKAALKGKTEVVGVEAYHGQVLERGDDDGDEKLGGVNDGWHMGGLKFKKHIDDAFRTGGDGRRVDDYEVIDSKGRQ